MVKSAMATLHTYPARRCWTVASYLFNQDKIMLIKHKKLGMWLAPGGHVEADELPHVAAERECWEETGITVRALDAGPQVGSEVAENLPHPFLTNLHWISQENYRARTEGGDRSEKTKKDWGKGCEQHLCFLYLVEPAGSLQFKENVEETDGIGWFTLTEVADLETPFDVKEEIKQAFKEYDRVRSHHQ